MDLKSNRQTIHYQSYLLRLWRESPEAEWRIMLKDIGTEDRRMFASTEDLCAFLDEYMADVLAMQQELDRPLSTES